MSLRLIGIWILSGAALVGCCGHNSRATLRVMPPECRVIRWVYHNDWTVCGEITVSAGGKYCFKDYDVWSSSRPITNIYSGTLPREIYVSLQSDSRSFPINGGVPTYENYIDDHHHKRPDGVESMTRYLWRQHTKPLRE